MEMSQMNDSEMCKKVTVVRPVHWNSTKCQIIRKIMVKENL
jgi:hypothetical protein